MAHTTHPLLWHQLLQEMCIPHNHVPRPSYQSSQGPGDGHINNMKHWGIRYNNTYILYLCTYLFYITHIRHAGPEKAGCPVGLCCVQQVVGDSHEGDLPSIQILVQHLMNVHKCYHQRLAAIVSTVWCTSYLMHYNHQLVLCSSTLHMHKCLVFPTSAAATIVHYDPTHLQWFMALFR